MLLNIDIILQSITLKILKLFESLETENAFFRSLKNDCSDFLSGYAPLYRGASRKHGDNLATLPIRTDRVSLSRNNAGHHLFNIIFEQNFDLANVRSRSAFVSSSYKSASTYGYVYYVFPKNNSTLIFNRELADSFNLLRRLKNELIDNVFGLHKSDIALMTEMVHLLNEQEPVTLIDLENIVSRGSPKIQNWLEETLVRLYNFGINGYEISTPNKFTVPSDPVEIMVCDSDSLYAISADYINERFDTFQNFLTWIEKQ